jgi:hypothetical protein
MGLLMLRGICTTGRVINEATGFDKESLNRSIKITVPTMGPNTNFKP